MLQFSVSEQIIKMNVASEQKIKMNVENIVFENEMLEEYDGSYTVIPMTEKQMLFTKNKKMIDDVQVLSIPIYNVSNMSGGYTVYIATNDNLVL